MAIDTIKSTAVLDGAIATADIADDAVTADKLANAINTSIAAKLPLAGGTMTGITAHGDGVASTFGDSADLTISHAGGSTYLTNTTGSLILRTDSFRVLNTANSEQILHGNADGAVVAYHNNAEKLTTTASGINVTGAVNSTGEMRITNPSATSQLYLYGAAGQKANIILNEYGVRAWNIGSGTFTSGQFSISDGSTEHMRIAHTGNVGINDAVPSQKLSVVGSGNGYVAKFLTAYAGQVPHPVEIVASNSAFTNNNGGWGMMRVHYAGSAKSSVYLIGAQSSAGSDAEFYVRGDGEVRADGSISGGGADYAEYFEWADGNPSNEDRRGFSVVLSDNKIRKAASDDSSSSIIGVISARPAVVGDNDIGRWKQKYLRSDFGDHVMESYTNTTWIDIDEQGKEHSKGFETDKIPADETVPSDAVVSSVDDEGTVLMRKQLNPDWDETLVDAYIPRADRKEWATVGLMGKLRILKTQPTGDRWIKMRDVSDTVEEWLVR